MLIQLEKNEISGRRKSRFPHYCKGENGKKNLSVKHAETEMGGAEFTLFHPSHQQKNQCKMKKTSSLNNSPSGILTPPIPLDRSSASLIAIKTDKTFAAEKFRRDGTMLFSII